MDDQGTTQRDQRERAYPAKLLQALRTAMTTTDPGSFLEACDAAADAVLERLKEKKRGVDHR
jgi:hypothetical protein